MGNRHRNRGRNSLIYLLLTILIFKDIKKLVDELE